MIVIMIVICYLLIGASMGLKYHKIVEEVTEEVMVQIPTNLRGAFTTVFVIVIIVAYPIKLIYDLIMKLKPNKKSSKR